MQFCSGLGLYFFCIYFSNKVLTFGDFILVNSAHLLPNNQRDEHSHGDGVFFVLHDALKLPVN